MRVPQTFLIEFTEGSKRERWKHSRRMRYGREMAEGDFRWEEKMGFDFEMGGRGRVAMAAPQKKRNPQLKTGGDGSRFRSPCSRFAPGASEVMQYNIALYNKCFSFCRCAACLPCAVAASRLDHAWKYCSGFPPLCL